ncbi:MAG: (2Fe-2S)-binding protein [Fretibacterium sp.]|nr:(2Fe-2S)-binding protein [Fretibacterium sp.]
MKKDIKIKVNGLEHAFSVEPNKTLLSLIRDDLGLTGTKEGCDVGECGACTVIMNGKAICSCLMLAVNANGADVLTVEGLLHEDGTLDPLQQAFIDEGAVQCGFCTPGMLMSAKAFLMQNPHPTEDEIMTAIEGNICRCTGYLPIVKAIKKAATLLSSD